MGTDDEWYYHELLKLLKEKNEDTTEKYYKPLELELPLEPLPEIVEKEEEIERGVALIYF